MSGKRALQSNQEPGLGQLFHRETWALYLSAFDVEYYVGVIVDPFQEQFEREL